MEWAAGWSKIAASTARERPGAALAVAASVAAALPVMLVALVFAAVAFAALALPLGIATAAWWVTLRPRARGRDSPSSILTRLREGTLRLSSVPEGSAEPGSARGSLASPRASLTPAGLRLGNPPVDLLVVYAGSTESDAAPGRDFFDAARMVAARIKEKLEAQHERETNEKKNEEFVVALANAAWLARDASATELATTLADFADAVVFVVESSSSSVSSSASRAFRKKLQGEIKTRHGGSAESFFASTRRKACAPFCAVTISRRGRETSERGDGASSAPRRAGGFVMSDDFDKAMGDLLLVDSGETTDLDLSRDSLSRVTHQEKKVSSSRRLCESCDADAIERNGPGALDRWTREVLYPALKDPFFSARGPTPPRVLCLSSTHTNLLLRHLDARHLVVGCEPWYEDTPSAEGETEPKAAPIPRVDPLKLDSDEIERLDPTLVVCAYESVADALRKFGPKWDVPDAERSIAEKRSSGKDLSFEVVVLECPLGRDALERAAAQIVELARVTRLDAKRARAAADTLRFGILEIRAKAERAFGGDFARSVSSSSRRDGETDRLETPSRPQPFVFIEADPLLYSADSCTPLGAALAEGLGVGNVADVDVSARRDAEKDDSAARVSARAVAALAKRMGRDVDASDTAYDDDDDSTSSSQHTHYPRLPAQRFWNPREPDWWIVAHPTNGGASGTSFADSLDAEDRDRHAALREGRMVTLSDALCHAASQWTPELVDVVEAVFQKMLEKARKTNSASEEVANSAPRGTGTETKKEKTKKDAEASRGTAEESESCEEPFVDASDVFDARFRDRNLRALPPSALSLDLPPLRLTSLDLSRNELSELPGLAALAPTLRVLTLERNWFSRVPAEVGALRALEELNLSRNFLRPGDDALALDALRSLKRLRVLDLRWNRKVCTAETSRRLSRALGGDSSANDAVSAGTEIVFEPVDVRVTISFPAPAGAFVGSDRADRDASCLRAQLEPWSTLALRRRLVEDFGEDPESVEDPEEVPRSLVVARLLAAYEREGPTTSNKGVARRRAVRVRGAPVSAAALDDLNALLRAWLERRLAKGAKGNVQERPSVNAKAYMILRSPTDFNAKLGAGSRKARQAADKFAAHEALWRAAERALREVDPGFADAFTALAVTYGFQGSPHIDKQNVGPFYGLALGDFDDDTGGVVVEADARTVCVVDTKHRLGKVDGRFPHWVAPWDVKSKERFSLIYYRTMGEPEPITSAAFDERGVAVHVDQDLSEGSYSGEERGDE